MIVSVASGKGGTGKTTVSAALATLWDGPVTAVDLDVEEPNLHLFLRPDLTGQETAHLMVPVVDEARCSRCRACSELCQFKAIAVMGEVVLTFPGDVPRLRRLYRDLPGTGGLGGAAGAGTDQLGAGRQHRLYHRPAAGRRGHEPAPDAPGEGQAAGQAGGDRRGRHHRRAAGGELPRGERGAGQRRHCPGDRAHSLRLL